MFYLLFEIWFWIIAAFVLGVFLGWLCWGRHGLTSEDRIEYRVMKSRENSKRLLQGKYRITPLDEDHQHQKKMKKERDGPVRARHL